MNADHLPPLTPEQLRALDLGQGLAEFVDPATNRVYVVAESSAPISHSDEYVREKLAEAQADAAAGRFVEGFSIESFLTESRERQAGRS